MINLFCTLRKIILASQSPRRQHFLKELGIEYFLFRDLLFAKEKKNQDSLLTMETHAGDVATFGVRAKDDKEERPRPLELPEDYVFRTALRKVIDAMQQTGLIKNVQSFDGVGEGDGKGQEQGIRLEESTFEVKSDFSDILDMDRKEILHLSYLVEKYSFKSKILCHAKISPKVQHVKEQDVFETPLFITADTIVALGDDILGKPHDEADALDMLRRMVGRKHKVLTTVCVADLKEACMYSFTDIAHVHFAPWSTQLLEAYVKTGDPMDKAGSYGIQGVGMFLSDGIQGSWDTVAGLPVAKLLELLLHCEAIQVAS